MPHPNADAARVLIEEIETRYHEGHRQAFSGLLALAGECEASGQAEGMAAALEAFSAALELHMFKEEMRLFPMMVSGGGNLIDHLIADLQREHLEHAQAARALRGRLHRQRGEHGDTPLLRRLRQEFDALNEALTQHIRAEEEALFPLFAA